MSGKKGTSAKQKGHTTDNKHKTETSQKGKQTPQGGLKRFLTPSPVLINETLKKSRQISGGLSDVSEKLNMDEGLELETQEAAGIGSVESVEGMSVALTMDDKDVKKIANELQELILPDMRQIISNQIPDIQSIVDGAIKSAVSQINETLIKEVNIVKKENSELKKMVNTLEQKVMKLERDVDDGEQYSRRNSVRISGVGESSEEDTDRIILNIAKDLEADITLNDIDRSHRVGKSRNGRPRAIIVKFTSYRARRALYSKRMNLRHLNAGRNVFVNEDLTARRSELLFSARKYVKSKQLKTAYSSDGRVYVKDNNDVRHLIIDQADLQAFGILSDLHTEPQPSTSSAW